MNTIAKPWSLIRNGVMDLLDLGFRGRTMAFRPSSAAPSTAALRLYSLPRGIRLR